MRIGSSKQGNVVTLLSALLTVGAGVSQAATWDGAGGSGVSAGGDGVSYGDPLNWDTGVVPTGSTAVTIDGSTFGASAGSPLTINLGGSRTVTGLTSVSGFVKFTNSVSGDDFLMTGGAGTFTATNVVFDTNVGVSGSANSTTVGNLNFTNVTYSVPKNNSFGGDGFEVSSGKSISITGSNVNGDDSWVFKLGATSGSMVIDSSITAGRALSMHNTGTSGAGTANLTIQNNSTSTFTGVAAIGRLDGTAGTATVTVTDSRLNLLGTSAEFNPKAQLITSNATIETRGNVTNKIANVANFDGEGLTWIFNPLAATANYEVAGANLGNDNAGLTNNFSLDKLVLGTSSGRTMVLTDDTNNDGTAASSEALYVDVVELLNDTTIELNGLTLYYSELELNGHELTIYQTTSSGTSSILTAEPGTGVNTLGFYRLGAIPEPSAAFALVGLAALTFGRRGRRG